MNHNAHLINKPQAQPALPRTFWQLLTGAFWILYLYLLTPLLTLILWLFGFNTGYVELYQRDAQIEPFLLFSLPLIALVCAFALIGWAEYNRARFSSKHRRTAVDNVPISEIASALGANSCITGTLGNSKVIRLVMDDAARPMRATQLSI
ncbi:poly-beta-1,6-N-acetyl-D-glucosamine biosynthesis protein PgaD [Luteimonas sp. RIT-PG2_3]